MATYTVTRVWSNPEEINRRVSILSVCGKGCVLNQKKKSLLKYIPPLQLL